MKRFVCSVTVPMLAGLALALPSPALAATLLCPPLFVTDGDQVVCAVANYGALDRDVRIRLRDGSTGELVEPVLNATLPQFAETGIHHHVVPPDGSIAPAHPVICDIRVPVKGSMRGSFARLAGAAVVDDQGLPIPDFEDTAAASGGEAVECR
jgi:hypothetical protein